MSHKSIRLLIEDTAKSLGDDIQFTYGRTSDFNLLRDKRYPFITSDPLVGTPLFSVNNTSNYMKSWRGMLAFYELDKADSTEEQYTLILDDVDKLVDKFLIKLNYYSDEFGGAGIVIIPGQQEPFIKATADILTGYTLPIQITVPDDWEYCADGC